MSSFTWERTVVDLVGRDKLDGCVDVVAVHSSKQLGQYLKNNGEKDILFLVDQDLTKTGKTGTQIIEAFGIASKSILVTSRFAESQVQKDCERLNLKMIPKALAALVSIRIEPPSQSNEPTIVLIDDSASWRDIWQAASSKQDTKFHCFASAGEFFERAGEFRLDKTVIYIDSDLGDDSPTGESAALKIYRLGFREIHITTGHSAGRFSACWWIRSVIGKVPPF